MNGILKDKSRWFLEPVEPQMLYMFRIVYGLFMAYGMMNYFRIGIVKNMFVLPGTNFRYDFFQWLKPLPEFWMNSLLALLLLCAVAITIGFFFKWSCRIFALGYTYLFLLDKSIFNNHIYLFILLAILLSFTDADRGISVSNKSFKTAVRIPRWQIIVLQAQIVIVYFYGGIAKLTYDWMVHCQPVRILLESLSPGHFLAPILKSEGAVYLLSYGGLLLDLMAPLLLWYKPARRWAIFLFIIFNFTNSRIFGDIGVFPYLMLCVLIIFYEIRELTWANRLLDRSGMIQESKEMYTETLSAQRGSFEYRYLLLPYFIFQLVFPFRAYFLPNEANWTTIGNRFSWRMKVDSREVEEMNFYIIDGVSHQRYPVEIQTMVNDMQIRNMSMDPRSVADFARYVKGEALKYGVADPKVIATIRTKYNGRPAQYFVSPDADLSTVSYSPFRKLDWVVPLNKEYPE